MSTLFIWVLYQLMICNFSGSLYSSVIQLYSVIEDPLTKGLPPKVFHEHNVHMGVVSIDYM